MPDNGCDTVPDRYTGEGRDGGPITKSRALYLAVCARLDLAPDARGTQSRVTEALAGLVSQATVCRMAAGTWSAPESVTGPICERMGVRLVAPGAWGFEVADEELVAKHGSDR